MISKGTSRVFHATHAVLSVAEKFLKSHLHVEGLANIPQGPTLFVVNHFTRMETFILPYLLYKYTNHQVHSLADASLFQGWFGDFLHELGAVSTKSPLRNRTIVKELITGQHNWVIYPEGAMIKNKKIFEQGRLMLNHPDRKGPPFTGAAVLALKAEMYRLDYLRACEKGQGERRKYYEDRFGFTGPSDVHDGPLNVVPVNITYYPLRPGRNLFNKMAQKIMKEVPERLEEELAVEGQLLLSNSDVTIYIGKPMSVRPFVEPLQKFGNTFFPFVQSDKKLNAIIGWQRYRLTKQFMSKIYVQTAVNIDHIFTTALRHVSPLGMESEDFKRILFLSARAIQSQQNRRCHDSLGPDLVRILTGEYYQPYDSIYHLAQNDQALTINEDRYYAHQDQLDDRHDFHTVRIKNTVRVLANEFEPLVQCVDIIRRTAAKDTEQLRKDVSKILLKQAQEQYRDDYRAYHDKTQSKGMDVGEPFLLHRPGNHVGIVLSHGYLAAPAEVKLLADYLFSQGVSVYAPRLPGHGTAPHNMADVSWHDWERTYDQGYAMMLNCCRHVVLAGFSAGGLLALLSAARKRERISGVIAINPALELQNHKSHLVPVVNWWNDIAGKLNLDKATLEFVDNKSEHPETNYTINYLHGVEQLKDLRDACRKQLDCITAPTLLIQAEGDPVVKPQAAEKAIDTIKAQSKQLVTLPMNRHGIVRGEGCEQVFEKVWKFLEPLTK